MWFRKIRFRKEIKKRFEPVHPNNRKEVMMFCKDGYIKTYPSINAASKATGIGWGAIWQVATGRNKKTRSHSKMSYEHPDTKGYKWVTWEFKRQAELPWSINAIDYIKKWKIID